MFCVIRDLQIEDYNKGYYECLTELTKAPKQDFEAFKRFVEHLKTPPIYKRVLVLELQQSDETQSSIIGTGSVFFEYKTIHGGCSKAHIEDIVVLEAFRGRKLGLRLMELLKQVAIDGGSYKIELTCAKDNMKFYRACGFKSEEVAMSFRVPNTKKAELDSVTFRPLKGRLERKEVEIEVKLDTPGIINGSEQPVNFDDSGPKFREEFVFVNEEHEKLEDPLPSNEINSKNKTFQNGDTLNNGKQQKCKRKYKQKRVTDNE